MPIEVVSVRVKEHQHEERTPPGVVSEIEQRVAAGIVRRSEKMKEFSKEAEGRPKGAVEPSER